MIFVDFLFSFVYIAVRMCVRLDPLNRAKTCGVLLFPETIFTHELSWRVLAIYLKSFLFFP